MIGDDCQIKPGAQIINSVLGQGCFVEERARVENSVIWPHTRIGTAAEVSGAIAGRGCHIGRSAVVGPGSVLGDKTSLTDYTITGVPCLVAAICRTFQRSNLARTVGARLLPRVHVSNVERVAQAYADYLSTESSSAVCGCRLRPPLPFRVLCATRG